MDVLKIKFTPNGYEVKNENIGQGLLIIPTTDGKYVLINFTADGNFAKIYDDLQKLIKKLKEYDEDVAKIVENELSEDEGILQLLNME